MSGIQVGAFDPVKAFELTLFDLVQVAEAFAADNSGITPIEFLRATRAATERINAVSTYTMAALMGPTQDKIPDDVRREFQAQVDLDDMMETPDDKQRRMMRALRDITSWYPQQ